MNVLDQIRNDRERARQLADPNAALCFLALADGEGNASVRTLVLRDIVENRFRLFINKSSPKWRLLCGRTCSFDANGVTTGARR